MKILFLLTKILIILSSISYSAFIFFISQIIASPTGLFGTPNTISEQTIGKLMMVISVLIAVTSLFILKKKNLTPFLFVLVFSILQLLAFSVIEGFDNENTLFTFLYLIVISLLYKFNKWVEKRSFLVK